MQLRWLAPIAAVAPLVVCAGAGHACGEEPPPQAVAVLSVDVGGNPSFDPGALKARIRETLVHALGAGGYQVTGQETVSHVLARNRALAGCYSQGCLTTLADLLKVHRFVHGHVDAFGQSFAVSLDLYASDRPDSLVAHVEERCDVCTLPELNDTVAKAADELRTRDVAPTPPSTSQPVTLDTQPTGASVAVDGRATGTTPVVVSLAPGPHRLVVDKSGYLPQERSFSVGSQPATLTTALVAGPTGGEQPRPLRTWKWVAAGGAAAVLVTGLVLISLDGEGTCGSATRQCPNLYDTATPGYAFVGLGLAGAVGATALFLFDQRAEVGPTSAPVLGLAPTQGGIAASVAAAF